MEEKDAQKGKRRPWTLREFGGKTIWDWMGLLIVPVVLSLITVVFAWRQDISQDQIEEKRAKAERALAEQRAQDAALQAYLDEMGALLLEKDLRSSTNDDATEESKGARTLARARTLTVLSRLDPRRRAEAMRFLIEAGLVLGDPVLSRVMDNPRAQEPVIRLLFSNLHGVDLDHTALWGADLADTNLTDADLSGANLFETRLDNADLSGADLSKAILSEAHLFEAHLDNADLVDANLVGADMSKTVLRGANLSDANLNEADLSGAKGVTNEQLRAATSLEGATMPDGQTLRGEKLPNGPTLEEWIKDRENRRENE